MPKANVTKEKILSAALMLVRREGYEALNARRIAQAAGCSVQPLYSLFTGMKLFMEALYTYACAFLDQFVEAHADRKNYFESIGQCHILFAQEEAGVFRFVFLSPYMRAQTFADIYKKFARPDVTQTIEDALQLTQQEASRLYMQMMLYTHGIASLLAEGAANFSREEIHNSCCSAYWAFLERIRKERHDETTGT